jgi:hypothetical protein
MTIPRDEIAVEMGYRDARHAVSEMLGYHWSLRQIATTFSAHYRWGISPETIGKWIRKWGLVNHNHQGGANNTRRRISGPIHDRLLAYGLDKVREMTVYEIMDKFSITQCQVHFQRRHFGVKYKGVKERLISIQKLSESDKL